MAAATNQMSDIRRVKSGISNKSNITDSVMSKLVKTSHWMNDFKLGRYL